jgi:hypothetical protein
MSAIIPTTTKLMSRPNGCKVPKAYLYRARNLVERFFSRINTVVRSQRATTNSLPTTQP